MKAASMLVLAMMILVLCAGAAAPRDIDRYGRVVMKGLSDEELIDPRLESGEMQDLLTSAQADTYCIVWYDFEQMNWQGWTQVDVTAQVDTFFHVDDFSGLGGGAKGRLVPIEGTQSMWCGVRDLGHQVPGCPGTEDYLCSWAAAPGYGNNWSQIFESYPVYFTGPVTVSYRLRCDIELGYDYVAFQWDNGWMWEEIARFEGEVDTVATYTRHSGQYSTKLRFHFLSDAAYSDQDGLWDTDGAVIIDSITISHDGGVVLDYEDFESADVGEKNLAYWHADVAVPFGQYSGLLCNLVDKDPCNDNFETQIVFIINSIWPSSEYPFPGMYDTPFCAGPGNIEPPCQNEMVVSPIINMKRYSTSCDENQDTDIPPGDLPDLGGVHLRFCVYEDLPVQNLVFYTWQVRSIDPSGCPGQWVDRNIWYWYPGGYYTQRCEPIGDLITSDSIQVGLACIDMCASWYEVYGNCKNHTPAPWFDNVRLYRYKDHGPRWSYRDLDLFQDNFPEVEFELESFVRADCANDLRPCNDPVIDPGDSVVVSCSSRDGIDTMPDGSPKVFMHLRCPYIGDPVFPKPALFGPSLEGNYGRYYSDDGSEWTVIQADYARTSAGNICPDRYMFDLNDSLITRGYRIDYYFEAFDLVGESSTLPTHPADETYFEWTCLPTLASDILYVDDYNRGAPPKGITQVYYDWSFFHVLPSDNQPDRYDVNNPTSMVSNGPGSRAKNYQLTTAYQTIIWDSGNLGECTISDGTWYSDKSNDCQMLVDWMEFSPHRVGLWVCGDDVAADLDGSPSVCAQPLLSSYCGVLYIGDSYYNLCGVVNPMLQADPNYSNPLWHGLWGDTFDVFGGCPTINDFDYIEKTGNGEYALDYPDLSGIPYYAGIYANGINDGGYPIRTMWFGFSFMYIRDAWIEYPMMRDFVVRDVVAWMENGLNPIPEPAGVDEIPLVNSLSQNYPNPFNPVTTIKFGVKEKGHVTLRVYDVAGRLVKTLVDDVRKAGHYEERWNGTNNRGSSVASGVYFYRLKAAEYEKTIKMVLLQ